MDAPPWGVLTAAAGATKNFASRSLDVFDGRTRRAELSAAVFDLGETYA